MLDPEITLTRRGWTVLGLVLAAVFTVGVVISPPMDACVTDPACPVHQSQR